MKYKIIDNDPNRVGKFVSEKAGGNWIPNSASAIGLEVDGDLIAGATYENFNGINVFCHISADSKQWSLYREFLWFIFYYPFEQLKVKRLTGIIPASNKSAVIMAKKMGFKQESVMKDSHPTGDMIVFAMGKEDCKFLRIKYE